MNSRFQMVCLLLITIFLFPLGTTGNTNDSIIPLYRMKNDKYKNHYYTTSALEKKAFEKKGYKFVAIIGNVYNKQLPGTVPLVRLYNKSEKNHFYTAHPKEIWEPLTTRSYSKYVFKETVGYVFKEVKKNHIPLYRVRNKALKKHFYTTYEDEYNKVRVLNDYKDEGIECYVLPK